MKKRLSFAVILLSVTALLGACEGKASESAPIDHSSNNPTSKSSSSKPSTSEGPKRPSQISAFP